MTNKYHKPEPFRNKKPLSLSLLSNSSKRSILILIS